MKNLTKNALLAAVLLGSVATHSLASTYAYEASKDTPVHKEFKDGDFNPYWFQEKANVAQVYAYEAAHDAPVYKEFKEGDFNPYWFQD